MEKNHKDFDWRKVQDKIEKVLGDEFFQEMTKLVPKRGPLIDVFETDRELTIVMEIPGLPSSGNFIEIYLEGYNLCIDGNIPCTYPTNYKTIQSERFFGSFKREISLPYDVSTDEIKAFYEKGLLQVDIPKTKGSQQTKISVQYREQTDESE